MTRALALQRPQIAALKALGYGNGELAWHYIKWGLAIAAFGSLTGVVSGAWLGSGLIGLYNAYFRFPVLDYRLSTDVAALSVVGSLVVAALGAQSAVRRAVRIPPAEAMRSEPPARYRQSLLERPWRRLRLAHSTRMVLRNIERQPVRSLVSITGIAFAVAVLFVGLAFLDVMDTLINQQFVLAMRQDATLSFVEPRSGRAIFDVERLPGVMDVEPVRAVPVRFRSGHRSRALAITGIPGDPELNRIVDRQGHATPVPPDGLAMSAMLGRILDVAPGETVQVEVLEGRRPVRDVPVAALIDDAMGLQAFMHIDALHRLMREGDVVTGAVVTIDSAQIERFYRDVKAMPVIAGVGLREVMLQNFRETMAETMNLSIFLN
ncbi:MAG: FtsX-like permease family protein, partial [Vicinamibacterales bacterium]